MDDELVIGKLKQLRADEVNPADKLLVRVAVDTSREDFAGVEQAFFPKLEELVNTVQAALKEFFDTTGAPSQCHVVGMTSLWVGVQIAMSAFDGIDTKDLIEEGETETEKKHLGAMVLGVKTDWRSSVILNLVKDLLAGYRQAQSEGGFLPEDLKACLERVAAAQRGPAN